MRITFGVRKRQSMTAYDKIITTVRRHIPISNAPLSCPSVGMVATVALAKIVVIVSLSLLSIVIYFRFNLKIPTKIYERQYL